MTNNLPCIAPVLLMQAATTGSGAPDESAALRREFLSDVRQLFHLLERNVYSGTKASTFNCPSPHLCYLCRLPPLAVALLTSLPRCVASCCLTCVSCGACWTDT